MSALETVNLPDLKMIQKANADLQNAQAVWGFVTQHLTTAYQLSPADNVDIFTGIITRAEATGNEEKAPEPKKAKRNPRPAAELTD